MIERDDIRAAVSAGVLNEAQAVSLVALADSRRGARADLAAGDEPFELFKGFNEIFIVVGLAILSIGWAAFAAVTIASGPADIVQAVLLRAAFGGIILWFLAEYFIRKRRMIAPAIALTLLFAANAAIGFNAWLAEPFMLILQNDITSLPVPLLATTAAVFVFWFRFRVPIALAFVALGLFAAAVVFSASDNARPETMRDFFMLTAESNYAWLTLALGIGTFIVAMMFDMSDPHRVTRRSANGFWLHVIAAPAIVNTVALSLLSADGDGNKTLLIAFLAVIALIAIVIDRRSFLITGVGYVVAVATTLSGSDGAAITILILGVALLLLGAFWERIRGAILRALPFLPLHRLPPIA